MSNFLHNIAPISVLLWVCFLFIPGVAAIIAQVILCLKTEKKALRFIPFYVAAFILLLVLIYRFTGALEFLVGGFVGMLLIGTVIAIVIGSGFVLVIYASMRNYIKK